MYFNKFPKIDYKFSNNQTLPVVDIFRKVSFSQESLQNSNIFINIVKTIQNALKQQIKAGNKFFLSLIALCKTLEFIINY